mmetsp:Transcript_45154/g.72332  ORF Transcript_45154/g.72332 Transcript_45154/m.72332 type:complete len:416 (+) Transcript_45154:375-1622(+)
MTSVADVFWLSFSSILPVFLIILIGVVCVKYEVLDTAGIKTLSRLLKWVIIPSMFFVRLGGGISIDLLKEVWMVVVAAVSSTLLNMLLSFFVLAPLAAPDPSFRPWFHISMTFPNLVALPLMFTYSLCRQASLKHNVQLDINGTRSSEDVVYAKEECVDRAELLIFIYAIIPTLALFTISHLASLRKGHTPKLIKASDEEKQADSVLSLANDTQEDIEEKSSEEAPPRPYVFAVLAGVGSIILEPTILSQIVSISIGLIAPLQRFLFDTDSYAAPLVNVAFILAPGLVPIINLCLAGSVGVKLQKVGLLDILRGRTTGLGISVRTLTWLTLGRMVVLPGVSYMILYFINEYLPQDDLLRLLLHFETIVPTANMVVIVSQISHGGGENAEIISLSIVFQYLIGIVTLPIWTLIALL